MHNFELGWMILQLLMQVKKNIVLPSAADPSQELKFTQNYD